MCVCIYIYIKEREGFCIFIIIILVYNLFFVLYLRFIYLNCDQIWNILPHNKAKNQIWELELLCNRYTENKMLNKKVKSLICPFNTFKILSGHYLQIILKIMFCDCKYSNVSFSGALSVLTSPCSSSYMHIKSDKRKKARRTLTCCTFAGAYRYPWPL